MARPAPYADAVGPVAPGGAQDRALELRRGPASVECKLAHDVGSRAATSTGCNRCGGMAPGRAPAGRLVTVGDGHVRTGECDPLPNLSGTNLCSNERRRGAAGMGATLACSG